jgi:hypothetical protein
MSRIFLLYVFKLSNGCDFGKLLAELFHKIVFKRNRIRGDKTISFLFQ